MLKRKNKTGLPVWVLSLGCPKNRVDTERFLGSIGLQVRLVKHPGHSRLIFINTCAFIEPAVRESIREILAVVEKVKNLKRKPSVVVAGCLPGRYSLKELAKEIPEVDLWLDAPHMEQWPEKLRDLLGIVESFKTGRLYSSPPAYAWLKIADGCDHKCSFCAIPAFRGSYHSEAPQNILAEAQKLVEYGARELILVGQDISIWGRDIETCFPAPPGKPRNLEELVEELARISGLEWLRLLYLYPSTLDKGLLKLVASMGRPLLPYLDIPFQHSEKKILASMGRPFIVNPRDIIEKVRSFIPDCALRTSLIVGYPGETEKDFERLCQFVREARFTNLGVFTYHAEDGTKAASLPEQVPYEIREERRRILMDIQAVISQDFLAQFNGQRMDVLVDSSAHDEWPGLYKGRVWFQAPEIDGVTYISGPKVVPGKIYDALIDSTHVYDLGAIV